MSASPRRPRGEPLYRLEDVEQRYQGRTALRVPSLTLDGGPICGIFGPSGAGKSTLLRLLAFVEEPWRGRVLYRGAPSRAGLDGGLAWRRRATMVGQNPVMLDRTVLENVAFGLRLRGVDGAAAARRALAALERVGLGDRPVQAATTLSGGEAQRVALARALVLEPEVLLLDEPTANLDPANVAAIEEVVRSAHAAGAAVVMVTHNLAQLRRMTGHALFLMDGEVAEAGPTEHLLGRPRDARTHAFLAGEIGF